MWGGGYSRCSPFLSSSSSSSQQEARWGLLSVTSPPSDWRLNTHTVRKNNNTHTHSVILQGNSSSWNLFTVSSSHAHQPQCGTLLTWAPPSMQHVSENTNIHIKAGARSLYVNRIWYMYKKRIWNDIMYIKTQLNDNSPICLSASAWSVLHGAYCINPTSFLPHYLHFGLSTKSSTVFIPALFLLSLFVLVFFTCLIHDIMLHCWRSLGLNMYIAIFTLKMCKWQ